MTSYWRSTSDETTPVTKEMIEKAIKRMKEDAGKPNGPWIVGPREYERLTGRKIYE